LTASEPDGEGLVGWTAAVRQHPTKKNLGVTQVVLQPFPSVETKPPQPDSPFALALVNRSTRPRKYTYRVYTIADDPLDQYARDWLPWDENGELLRGDVKQFEAPLEAAAETTRRKARPRRHRPLRPPCLVQSCRWSAASLSNSSRRMRLPPPSGFGSMSRRSIRACMSIRRLAPISVKRSADS
jgi:hypothetical protein